MRSSKRKGGAADAAGAATKRRQAASPYVAAAACLVCCEAGLQLAPSLGQCKHPICRSCMAAHLLHAFTARQGLPVCPVPLCRSRLGLQSALSLLEQQVPGSSILAKQALLAPDVLDLLALSACPYADCQVPIEFEAPGMPGLPAECPACERPVCSSCGQRWHEGLSCAQSARSLAPGSQAPAGQQCQQQRAKRPWKAAAAAAAAAAVEDDSGWQGGEGMAWSPTKP